MKYPQFTLWKQGGVCGEGVTTHPFPQPFLQHTSMQIFQDDVNSFNSFSDIFLMVYPAAASIFPS